MDRIDSTNAVDIGAGKLGFQDEILSAGAGSQEGTFVSAYWLNGVQEELMTVIEVVGLVGDKTKFNLLGKAIQSGKLNYAVAGGTANALTVALSPVPESLAAPLSVIIKATANNTDAATLDVNGLGAVGLMRLDGSDLAPNDILTGDIFEARFDGTAFRIMRQLRSNLNEAALKPVTTVMVTTVGASTWTVPVSVRSITVRAWGAGGGGGYSSNSGAASGGSSGAFCQRNFAVSPGDTVSLNIGAGGVGGAASPPRSGQPGLQTTVTVGAITMTAGGGPGGNNADTLGVVADSPSAAAAANGDLNVPGGRGNYGVVGYGPVAYGGNGAQAPLGGSPAMGGSGAASDGVAPGGGASANGNPSYAGGTGAGGQVQISYVEP